MPRRSKFLVEPMMSGLPVRIVYRELPSRLAFTSGSQEEWRLPVKSVPLSRLRRMAAFAAAPEPLADLVSPLGNMRGIPGVAARSGLLRRAQPLVLQPRPRAPLASIAA